MRNAFILLLFALSCSAFSNDPDFISCGINDIDQIRKEVKTTPTTIDNVLSRRATLYRWWRLMWHQGYDMDAFDEVAEWLLVFPDSTLRGRQSITIGFTRLEEMMLSGNRIKEIRGAKPKTSSTRTNWPLYHGIDGTQSGYSPDEGPSSGNITWKFPKSYGCNISPIIDSGRIYIPGVGDDVIAFCLDEENGDVIWKGHKYGTDFYSSQGLRNRAFVSNSELLVWNCGRFSIFNKTTGKRLSQSKESFEISRPENLQPKIIKRSLNHFSCIDAETGITIKEFHTSRKVSGQPIPFNNMAYYVSYDGRLIAEGLYQGNMNWQKDYHKELDGTLSINENGTIYMGANDGCLLAVNAINGEIKWIFSTESLEPRSRHLFSELLTKDDRLYLGTANKMVYCLNADNGTIIWKYQVDDWVRSKPVFVEGCLYVATLSGTMYAIKDTSNSPQIIWKTKVAEHGFTSNIKGSFNGILGISQNLMLYSVSTETGIVQWRHGLMDGMYRDGDFFSSEELGGQQSSPVVVDGVLYIGGTDGFVNAIDSESGKEIWRFETDGIMASSPTVAFGKVFFGEAYNAEGTYYALDAETGMPEWKSEAYGNVWVNATFDDKNIYFGNMKGYFFAVNPNDGEVVWRYNTAKDTPLENVPKNHQIRHGYPPGVYCNPVYKNGLVYTGSWAGYYFAFDANSGELIWRTKTMADDSGGGLPDSSAPVWHKNHLYVQKEGWKIAAINIKSGKIDWEWNAPLGYLQNGTVTAFDDKIFASIVRGVTKLPYDASVIAFNDVENGGDELWRYKGGGGLTAAVATKNKLVFGSSGDVFISCVNPENGELIWRTYTGGMMLESVPALYGNKVFVQSKSGFIYAIE